jgi:hypothetical protein
MITVDGDNKATKMAQFQDKKMVFLSFFETSDSHQILQHEFSWSFLSNNSSLRVALGLKSMLYTHCGFCNNG